MSTTRLSATELRPASGEVAPPDRAHEHPLTPGEGAPRREWKRSVLGGAALLGSSAAASVGFALLTSGRWSLVDRATAVFAILFVQWETVGLTVAKLGIDQIVFAAITHDPGRRPDVADHLRRRSIPLALAVGVVVAFLFSPLAGAACALAIVCDTESTVLVADLNAREQYGAASIAALLNYPVFFGLLFAAVASGVDGHAAVLGAFVASSITRWLWLRVRERRVAALPPVRCTPGWAMGGQQLLNYVLFKSDQLLLGSAVVVALTMGAAADVALPRYLFLARFPELASGVAVALGGVLLPRLFVPHAERGAALATAARRGWPLMVLYLAGGVAGALVYRGLWKGDAIATWALVPFALAALLALPVNALTYSMLRQGYLRGLLRALVASCALGGVVAVVALVAHSWLVLAFAAPVQLACFAALVVFGNWREHRPLYG